MPSYLRPGHHMDWSYDNIMQMPRSIAGIYVIWCPPVGKQIYVGKAERRPIRTRLREHWQGSHNQMLRWWIQEFGDALSICYLACPRHRINELERRLIAALKPEANIRG